MMLFLKKKKIILFKDVLGQINFKASFKTWNKI